MSVIAFTFIVFAFICFIVQILSLTIVSHRLRRRVVHQDYYNLGVTLLRPLSGLENNLVQTIESSFTLEHTFLEIIFCIVSIDDPAYATARFLMAKYPRHDAKILVGAGDWKNPKLGNLSKGWNAAKHDWVLMVDSNVLLPADAVAVMFDAQGSDVGLVSSPPVGCAPKGFWAELECAFLNSYQARWQLMADEFDLGFAQGKAMLWRKTFLNAHGGLEALTHEAAEDAAATKVVNDAGRRVAVVCKPFLQPLGQRTLSQVWYRQLRWARLRRASFPLFFAPELLSGSIVPLLAICLSGYPWFALILAAYWYALELIFAHTVGWQLSPYTLFAMLLRDVMIPILWFGAIIGDDFVWQGNSMTTDVAKDV